HHNVGHVLDAAELVELHVGIDLPAGVLVEDGFLEQGVVNAHDDAAGYLRFAALLVDDEATVLDRDNLGAAGHAGFGIDLDLGNLDAADTGVGEALRPVAVAHCRCVLSQPRAGLPPRNRRLVAADSNPSRLDG